MNELIKSLSLYNDIPLFVRIIELYNEEQHMPSPDYDYELERLQKEINELEHKKIHIPEWDNILTDLKMYNTHAVPGNHGPTLGHLLRYTNDMDEQTTIDFIDYCFDDTYTRLSICSYYCMGFSHAFDYYKQTNKTNVFIHLIENILPDIYAEYSSRRSVLHTFHDLLIITGIRIQSYTTLRWLIERYNISDSTLNYVNHRTFYRECEYHQWSNHDTESLAALLWL